MKKLIKADVTEMPASDLVGKAGYVLDHLRGNPHFPTPFPTLDAVEEARTRLMNDLREAESFARAAIALKNASADRLRAMLTTLASYVNVASNGDILVAVSSGFEACKKREAVALTAPAVFTARRGDYEGSIDLSWRRVPGIRMYNVYMTSGNAADPDGWTCVAHSSRIRCSIRNLRRSGYFSFCVTAVGAAGEGPRSQVSTAKAA